MKNDSKNNNNLFNSINNKYRIFLRANHLRVDLILIFQIFLHLNKEKIATTKIHPI